MGRAAGFKPGQTEEDDLPWYVFGAARRAALSARKSKSAPVMGSDKNIPKQTITESKTTPGNTPAKTPAKPPMRPAAARKPAGEYVAPSSIESQQTAGIAGLPGAQSGVSEETGSNYGKTTYFGETPEDAAQVAQQTRKGLFGEEISQKDWDEMERKNKESSFWGKFKKGGQVKKPTKKYASGGSVKGASRGDGCCQRGKTKGRFV